MVLIRLFQSPDIIPMSSLEHHQGQYLSQHHSWLPPLSKQLLLSFSSDTMKLGMENQNKSNHYTKNNSSTELKMNLSWHIHLRTSDA
jgi:hypothetical protein